MFTRSRWFQRGSIKSDEGFTVAFGRDVVVYREHLRKMAITADIGTGQANVFVTSIGRWDDDPMNAANELEVQRIADNVKRALEWRGFIVSLM